jgi:hypothetical protein
MQEYTGRLASGRSFRATSYLVEITDVTSNPETVIDVNDIIGITRNGTSVTIRRSGKQPTIVMECVSLDDAGRLEGMIRPQLRQAADYRERSGRGLCIAVMVTSLMLSLIVLFQTCASSIGDSLEGDEEASGSTATGALVTLLFIAGGAFVFAKPRVSMVLFILAGVLGIPVGATSDFGDLLVWGIVAFWASGNVLLRKP